MAKIYPERIPEYIKSDPKRSAEIKVYQALSQLPDSYVIFYGVGWQIRTTYGGAQDGESDFVIAHPALGVMILEVKGGQIRYDAKLKQWFSVDRAGVEHAIKDPVEQARNSKGTLLRKLQELPNWDNRFLTVAYQVVFPDVIVENINLRPDLSRELIIDHRDLSDIERKVQSGFEWFFGNERKRGDLGIARLHQLENLLASSFTLKTPLGVALEDEDKRLIELTEDQMKVLRYIQCHRRARIEGCAGSGKTMLALEKARQLSNQGFATLLVCFNAPLAEYLRLRAPEGVDVFNFHDLCRQLAKEAGIGFRSSNNEQDYFNRVLPEMLLDAIGERGPQYDAIIVDEGQDFLDEWWETLFFLLNDHENGIFYAFYDNNQNLYRRSSGLERLIPSPPLTLWENCRNTRSIHDVVKQLHDRPEALDCRAPLGRKPEVFFFSDQHQQEQYIQSVLHHLVIEEQVEPSHIILLTTRNPERTSFFSKRRLGNFELVHLGDSHRGMVIRTSSVHRFKGLESRVVILTGLEDNDPDWLSPILYVACSRARTHLIMIAHERSRQQIEALLQRGAA